MFKYILQRIVFAILALFIISIFVYALIAAYGPNPLDPLAQEQATKTHESPDFVLKGLEAQSGLRYGTRANPGAPVPIIIRYAQYMKSIFVGDFSNPLYNAKNNPDPTQYTDMLKLFFIPLGNTIQITGPAFIFSTVLGIGIGILAGYKRGKFFDSASNMFVLIFIGIPSFILAPFVIAISVKIGILSEIPRTISEQPFGVRFLAFLPPIIVMTLGSLAAYVTYTRNQVVTVLTSNYILIAKSKGLSGSQILFKYVLRNISIPLFGLVFGSFLGLLSGSIIIEKYWNVNGTSQVIVNSFPTGEIKVAMFSTLFFTLISLIAEIIVDISYVILDPKITYAAKSERNYFEFFKAYRERRRLVKGFQPTETTID